MLLPGPKKFYKSKGELQLGIHFKIAKGDKMCVKI